ncbi:MAG TPA: hypothetical protein VF587_13045 [Solirubrobacteraceae bacterium]|jgi:hypothetical protein
MSVTLAAVGGSAIVVGVAVLMLVVVAYSYYSIKGSGIAAHPSDGLDGAPGAEGPSDAAKGRGSEGDEVDGNLGGTFSSHGTR